MEGEEGEEGNEDEHPPWKKLRLESDEEDLDLGYTKTWADFATLPVLETEVLDIFIGRSELEDFTWRSRAFGPQFLGNSILLQMGDLALAGENRYIFLGKEMFGFETQSEIVKFSSPMGNSLVPYTFAVDADGRYFLFVEKVILETMPAQSEDVEFEPRLRPFHPYHYLYEEFKYDKCSFRLRYGPNLVTYRHPSDMIHSRPNPKLQKIVDGKAREVSREKFEGLLRKWFEAHGISHLQCRKDFTTGKPESFPPLWNLPLCTDKTFQSWLFGGLCETSVIRQASRIGLILVLLSIVLSSGVFVFVVVEHQVCRKDWKPRWAVSAVKTGKFRPVAKVAAGLCPICTAACVLQYRISIAGLEQGGGVCKVAFSFLAKESVEVQMPWGTLWYCVIAAVQLGLSIGLLRGPLRKPEEPLAMDLVETWTDHLAPSPQLPMSRPPRPMAPMSMAFPPKGIGKGGKGFIPQRPLQTPQAPMPTPRWSTLQVSSAEGVALAALIATGFGRRQTRTTRTARRANVTGPGWTDELARIFDPRPEGPGWQPEFGYSGRPRLRLLVDAEDP
eukprot:s749_g16.t1